MSLRTSFLIFFIINDFFVFLLKVDLTFPSLECATAVPESLVDFSFALEGNLASLNGSGLSTDLLVFLI